MAAKQTSFVFPAGSFYATPPGMVHQFAADDTVVQGNSTGPWGINYVNPKDDPRQKSQKRPRTCLRCSGAILSAWIDPVSHNSAVHHHRDHDNTIRP